MNPHSNQFDADRIKNCNAFNINQIGRSGIRKNGTPVLLQ